MQRNQGTRDRPSPADASGSAPAIAFLFRPGRHSRLAGSSGPREFFYGATEIPAPAFAVTMIEEDDLGEGFRPRWLEPAATLVTQGLAGLNAESLARFSRRRTLERLSGFAAVVATTNSQGLALALARARRRLATPVLVLAMGILEPELAWHRHGMRVRLLGHVALAPLAQAEEEWLRDHLGPGADVARLPFGVDAGFWSPADDPLATGNYVLSIGNDPRRDYATLTAAWDTDLPALKIVTGLPVPGAGPNVQVIAGDWSRSLLSDAEVRDLYRGALFVVLPLHPTIQPSGQSACLQAMACGKAVVLTETAGLWDRDFMRDGDTCLLVPPRSPAALREAAERLFARPSLAAAIGERARLAVANHLNLARMGRALERRLGALVAGGVGARR